MSKPDRLFFDSVNEQFKRITPFSTFTEGTSCAEQQFFNKIKLKYSENKYFLNIID